MEYLIGAIIAIALFLCVYGGYTIGTKHKAPKPPETKEDYEAKKRMEEFDEVMKYNLTKALERKR